MAKKSKKAKKQAQRKVAKSKKKAAKNKKKAASKSKSNTPKPPAEPDPRIKRLEEIAAFAKQIEDAENETAVAEADYLKLKEATAAKKKEYESKVITLRATIRRFRGDSGINLFNQPETNTAPDAANPGTVQLDQEAWRDVSIGDLDISDGAITKLAGHKKIATLGDLSDYMKRNELSDIKGIGAVAATKIEDALQAWFAANPDKCPPLKAATGDHKAEPAAPAPKEPAPKAGDPDFEDVEAGDPHAWKGIGIDTLRARPKIGEHSISDGMAVKLTQFEILSLGSLAESIADGSINTIKGIGPAAVDKIVKAFTAFGDQFSEYRLSMVAAATGAKGPAPGDGNDPKAEEPLEDPEAAESGQATGTAVIGVELTIDRIDYSVQELIDALIARVTGACSTPFEIDGKLYVTLDYNDVETRIELCEVVKESKDTPADAEILTDSLLSDNYEFLEKNKLIIVI